MRYLPYTKLNAGWAFLPGHDVHAGVTTSLFRTQALLTNGRTEMQHLTNMTYTGHAVRLSRSSTLFGLWVYFHGSFYLFPWKLPPTFMEVKQRSWKLPSTSMEVILLPLELNFTFMGVVYLLLPWESCIFCFHGNFRGSFNSILSEGSKSTCMEASTNFRI